MLSHEKFTRSHSAGAVSEATNFDLCYDPAETSCAKHSCLTRHVVERCKKHGGGVLSDRHATANAAHPPLFATGAVHHALIDAACAARPISWWRPPRCATPPDGVLGYGAPGHPYLAYQTIIELVNNATCR